MKIINWVIFAAVFAFSAYVMVQHTAKSSIFYGDSLGYYAYLPAFFIHDNVAEIQKVAEVSSIDKYARQNIVNWEKSYAINDNGNVIIQYTYGVAAMHAPFFLVAHLIDIVKGGAADGYNKTYIWGIRVAGFVYCYLGFLLLYRLFRRLGYEKSLIFFVLGVVFWGTNLWWFTIYQSGMAHVIIFFLVAGTVEKVDVIDVQLPEAQSGELLEEGPIEILLGRYNEVIANDTPMELQEVADWIAPKLKDNPSRVVSIKADARLEAARMIDLLDSLKAAGATQISLTTQGN